MITKELLIKNGYRKHENKNGILYYKRFNGYNICFVVSGDKIKGSTIVGDFKHDKFFTIRLDKYHTLKKVEQVHKFDYNNYVIGNKSIIKFNI